jgi:two-component system NarL family sensor kinase
MSESILLHLYRILQEAINNTIKHAQATQLEIEILETDLELFIRVKDNGKGFSSSNLKPGIGIKNMQKRVQALQGNYKISNAPTGTTVDISIPKTV